MTTGLLTVRQAIATVLQTVDGIDNVYGYVAGSPTPPCAIVGWPDVYNFDRRIGTQAWEGVLPVQLLVATGSNQSADEHLGSLPDLVNAAFDADPTLGGTISGYCVAVNATQFGIATYADAGVQYLSCIVNLEAMVT